MLASAAPASAHGFGQRYDLPLPLSLYLFGAGAVIVATFALVALLPGRGRARRPRLVLPAAGTPVLCSLAEALRLAALIVFLLTVSAGLLGDQNPYRNIAPTMTWIIVWVGLAYVSAFVGDIWALINPWRTIFEWVHAAIRRIAGAPSGPPIAYPDALDAWPAVALLFALAFFELVYPTPAVPAQIAWVAFGYSVLTFAGMTAFGAEAWLRHGEVFSVAFSTFARFAPTEARPDGARRVLVLRPFGAGLTEAGPASASMTAFVLLLLSSVLYDGLLNTPGWSILEDAVVAAVGDHGGLTPLAIRTIGLLAFWLLFLGAYLAFCAMMSRAAQGTRRAGEIARHFAYTLVPIAIGYHLAHYLVFLLIQGQYIIPLASDPFGWGWNLFGTAGYRVDIAIVGARFAWYAAVVAIVIGHVVAVRLAHAAAMRLFEAQRAVLRSQVPLTALMVIYTLVSLSILAEPIVERRESAAPSAVAADIEVPADSVLPDPETGALRPVGPGRRAAMKLTYRVLGSTFHDGTRMNVADVLYAYSFAYRWGIRNGEQDRHYDPHVDAATAHLRRQLVALRAAGSDAASRSFRIGDVNFVRELLTFEVYATATGGDPERDAAVAPPWTSVPWHLLALMEEAVERGWAAFSHAEAARRGVEWLDIVRSPGLNEKLLSLVEAFERDGHRPAALQALVSAEDARRRWAALAAFYRERRHFLVANGPYRLKSWTPDGVTLEAFRDLTYPLGVGSYDAYAVPRRGFITAVERERNRVRLSGDIETVVRFARSHRIERQPIRSVAPDVLRRAAPECRYVVIDQGGRVVLAGTVALNDSRTFELDLGGRLAPGRYTMRALIAVNGNVMNADIRVIPLEISSAP